MLSTFLQSTVVPLSGHMECKSPSSANLLPVLEEAPVTVRQTCLPQSSWKCSYLFSQHPLQLRNGHVTWFSPITCNHLTLRTESQCPKRRQEVQLQIQFPKVVVAALMVPSSVVTASKIECPCPTTWPGHRTDSVAWFRALILVSYSPSLALPPSRRYVNWPDKCALAA